MLKISVIIPVYNAEQFLEKAVKSALQFSEVCEIILVEDLSTDNSLAICHKLATENTKIKLYQHSDKGNHGAGATRNLGMEKATGDFIAFLDADDYYLPNRFDQEKELFKNPKIEGVFGAIGTEFFSKNSEIEYRAKYNQRLLTTVNYPAEGTAVFNGLVGLDKDFGIFFHLNTLTLKKEVIIKNKLYFNPELRVHQDTDFILKLSFYSYLSTGMIDRAIAIRGVHDDNRITKIKPYSYLFYQNMFLLYQSLYDWSKKEENMSSDAKKLVKLRYLSFRMAKKRGLEKYFLFFVNSIFNPDLLKTRFRFHALNRACDEKN